MANDSKQREMKQDKYDKRVDSDIRDLDRIVNRLKKNQKLDSDKEEYEDNNDSKVTKIVDKIEKAVDELKAAQAKDEKEEVCCESVDGTDEHKKEFQAKANTVADMLKQKVKEMSGCSDHAGRCMLYNGLIDLLHNFTDTNKKRAQIMISSFDSIHTTELPDDLLDLLNKESYHKINISSEYKRVKQK